MRFAFVVLSFLSLGNQALAQYGVSNQRDQYGNRPRDGGAASSQGGNNQGVNQTTPNAGGIIRNVPAQPAASSPRATGTVK
jgi:hypothetical protein